MSGTSVGTFPDLSFVQQGRLLEIEAIEGGRQSNEFSTCPSAALGEDDGPVGLTPTDDIQETEERVDDLQMYVPYAQRAFKQRGLIYPFRISSNGASLEDVPIHADLARDCAGLSADMGVGDKVARQFELRSFRALHELIGGWAVCVGAPRNDGTGCRRAVAKFRHLLRDFERGAYQNPNPPNSGDYGMDGVWILGREWGGPVVLLQVKNSFFDTEKFSSDFFRQSDALRQWFGKRLDQRRAVITVVALNTILTVEQKEAAFEASKAGSGYHIIDCVDILFAERRGTGVVRDTRVEM